jgi:hypothetical protein
MRGKTDQVEFGFGGKKVVTLKNPKQRIIPHDMIHYVVEKCFPFEGFIELVFKGHEPGKIMMVLGGVAPKLSSEYSPAPWITESLVESLQALLWNDDHSFEDFQYLYRKACEMRKIEDQPIQREQFQQCMTLTAELTERWQRLPDGEALEFQL